MMTLLVLLSVLAQPVPPPYRLQFDPGVSNGIARPYQTKMRDFVSVKDWGCAGDGVTNDFTCLQNAITWQSTVTGRQPARLYLPAGTYFIGNSGPLLVPYTGSSVNIGRGLQIFGDSSMTSGAGAASVIQPGALSNGALSFTVPVAATSYSGSINMKGIAFDCSLITTNCPTYNPAGALGTQPLPVFLGNLTECTSNGASPSVVTCTTTMNHNWGTPPFTVDITNVLPAGYAGQWTVTSTTANTFTYTSATNALASPATVVGRANRGANCVFLNGLSYGSVQDISFTGPINAGATGPQCGRAMWLGSVNTPNGEQVVTLSDILISGDFDVMLEMSTDIIAVNRLLENNFFNIYLVHSSRVSGRGVIGGYFGPTTGNNNLYRSSAATSDIGWYFGGGTARGYGIHGEGNGVELMFRDEGVGLGTPNNRLDIEMNSDNFTPYIGEKGYPWTQNTAYMIDTWRTNIRSSGAVGLYRQTVSTANGCGASCAGCISSPASSGYLGPTAVTYATLETEPAGSAVRCAWQYYGDFAVGNLYGGGGSPNQGGFGTGNNRVTQQWDGSPCYMTPGEQLDHQSSGDTNITPGGAPVPASTAIAASPGGATEAGNTVTITTSAAHSLVINQYVTVAGVAVAGYNGNFAILSVPTSTTFTYTDSASGLAASGNGTVVPFVNGTYPPGKCVQFAKSTGGLEYGVGAGYSGAEAAVNFGLYGAAGFPTTATWDLHKPGSPTPTLSLVDRTSLGGGITGCSEVGAVATCTTTSAHGIVARQWVIVDQFPEPYTGYQAGQVQVTAVTATTFSYAASAGLSTPTTFTGSSLGRVSVVKMQWPTGAATAGPSFGGTTTFANLGAPPPGMMLWCSDCTTANPCAGAGAGAIARRVNTTTWNCL